MKVGELANYKIKDKIGWGGMGVVYIAEDLALGRIVALKFLAPYLVQDQEIIERFRAEARSQARLVHPYITMVYAFHETEDQAFLVLEYVDGETLESRLKRQGRFSVPEVLEVFRTVLQAVDYAHSRGIIHRDLKPGNIGLTSEGAVKVMDFGIALNIDESSRLTRTGHMVGSPHYMAPEQILGYQSDHRTDIYALGITLFEMLTGRVPFDGATDYQIRVAQINEPPPSPRALGFTDISPALEDVIFKAMAKDPNQRFADIREFLHAVEASVSGEYLISAPKPTLLDKTTQVFPVKRQAGEAPPSGKSPTPVPEPRSPMARLLPFLIALAVVGMVALVAIPLYFLGYGNGSSLSQPGTAVTAPHGVAPSAKAPAPSPDLPSRPAASVWVQPKAPSPDAPQTPIGSRSSPPVAVKPASPSLEPGPTPALNIANRLGGPESPASVPGKIPQEASTPKPSAVATIPPEARKPDKPPSAQDTELNLLKLLKTKLSKGGFPQVEVSFNEKSQLNVAGSVKDNGQREKVLQIVQSLGISDPITYHITVVKEKKPKKTRKRRSSNREEEAPSAPPPVEPVRPLLPKFD